MPADQESLLPKEGNEESGEQPSVQMISVKWEATLPPPEMLRAYDEVSPGLADRLVSHAEKEMTHRHKAQDRLICVSAIGRISALISAVGVLGGIAATAVLAVVNDQPWVAGSASGFALVIALAAAVIGFKLRNDSDDSTPGNDTA